MIVISISSYTVEPPCAITSCEQPPPMSDHLSKTPNFPSQNPIIKPLVNGKLSKATSTTLWPDGYIARDGTVVRALASHQCGPGSNPGVDAIRGLSLLLVLSLALRGFSPGTAVFPSPQKPAFSNSNSTMNHVDEEPLCGCATSKSSFISFIKSFPFLTSCKRPVEAWYAPFCSLYVLLHSENA